MEKRSSFKIAKLVIFDLLIIFSAFNISFFLRGQLNSGSGSYVLVQQYSEYFLWYIGIVVVVKMVLFLLFGMYRRVWKYASIKDMMAIIEAVVLRKSLEICFHKRHDGYY